MLGWDFRGGNKSSQPTLTMHSRVSYIAYIGGLDLALCWVLAKEIGERIGHDPEDFAFRWNLSSSQFHGFKSLPALYSLGLDPLSISETRYPDREYPTLKMTRYHQRKVSQWVEEGRPLDEQKYGPLKRIMRRYTEYINEDFLPAVPVEDLTFDALRASG